MTQPGQVNWNEAEIPTSGNQKDLEPLILRITRHPAGMRCGALNQFR